MIDYIFFLLADNPLWVTLAICAIQLAIANKTREKLHSVNSIFSKDIVYTKQTGNFPEIICNQQGKSVNSPQLKVLIDELNEYIRKNEGTTDFSIIQHKTERIVNSQFDDAISRISFPTYIGLIGTFLGVLIGLYCFKVSDGGELVTDDKIEKLIHGVLISMSTSLIGLILMTLSNSYAASVRKELDREKNRFYGFIQNELMPELGTSIVSALSKLRSSINKFEPAFSSVIDKFQKTFDKCTSSFGDAFRANVNVVANAVSTMGVNMEQINKNVTFQQKLLDTLQSSSMNKTLDKFISTTNRFDSIAESISSLNQTKEKIIIATQQLVEVQHHYNDSLVIPQSVAERLNDILSRMLVFENSINQLGERLAQEQMVGNSVINSINSHLDVINQKNNIAANYVDVANDELEKLYKQQTDAIKKLNDKYSTAISSHGDEFEEMLTQVQNRLDKKWKIFVATLDDSFNISDVNTDLSYLKKLDVMEKQLSELKVSIEEYYTSKCNIQEVKQIDKDVSASNKKEKDKKNLDESDIAKSQYIERLDDLEKEITKQNETIGKLNLELEKANKSIMNKLKSFFWHKK